MPTAIDFVADTNLIPNESPQAAALANAIELWAHVSTAPDLRRARDITRDKRRAATEFFAATKKPLSNLTPLDVRDWQTALIKRGLKSSTVYVRLSSLQFL